MQSFEQAVLDALSNLSQRVKALESAEIPIDVFRGTEIYSTGVRLTPEGGIASLVVAGEALNAGEVIYIASAGGADGKVYKNPIDGTKPCGIVYEDVDVNGDVWIVVSGVCDVLPESGVTATRGYLLYSSNAEAGRADQSATVVDKGIGLWLDTGTGAGVATRAIVNFDNVDSSSPAAIDASSVTYTPTTATDWDSDADPGDVDNALDQLAERVDDLEGAQPTVTIVSTIILGDTSATLTIGTDKNPVVIEAPVNLTVTEVRLVARTAPTGQAIIVDVNVAGTTIFTNQANRPQIADAATEGNTTTIDDSSISKGENITFDIDQIGSGTAGGVITVAIICNQSAVVS